MISRIVSPLLAGLLLASACAPLLGPRAAKRYVRMAVHGDSVPTREDWVDVSVFSLPIPPASTARDLFVLAGEGQAAYIEALAARAKEGASLPQAFAAPIQQDRLPAVRDLNLVKRRMVFSIENRSNNPADRLVSIRLHLFPDSVELLNWDKLATAYDVIDLGSLTFGQSATMEAGLGATLGPLAPTLSASGTSSLQEQIPLRQRVVSLSGTLNSNRATLLQQSGNGRDLTGNIVVDLEMRLDSSESPKPVTFVTSPGESDNAMDCAKRPIFRQQTVLAPRRGGRPVKGRVVVEYVLRHVLSGHETLHEGDDEVVYLHGRDSTAVELIPARELGVRVWRIHENVDGQRHLLHGRRPGQSRELLQFDSYEDARRVVSWIAECGAAPMSRFALMVYERSLADGEKPRLRIRPVDINRGTGIEAEEIEQ